MIGIVDYGSSNLRSVEKAFESLKKNCTVTGDADKLSACSHIVLPGVGSFRAGMDALKSSGLDRTVKAQALAGKPLLGICLGMQMLLETGEEGGEYAGLGLIPGSVRRFPDAGLKIPHIGWNDAELKRCKIFTAERAVFYFVHSYYCDVPSEFLCASTDYGINFASAVCRDNVYGVQFHPEKSGSAGLEILENFASIKA